MQHVVARCFICKQTVVVETVVAEAFFFFHSCFFPAYFSQ